MSSTTERKPPPKSTRDFSFIKPSQRRLSEYEALTIHQQPEETGFDRVSDGRFVQEGFFLRPDGGYPWQPESTRLKYPDWYAFRDPAQHWQRTYVRHQEQQESAIERTTEDAGLNGTLSTLSDAWVRDILSHHYRVWSFFEYAIFRALAAAQREALADSIGNVLCFQSFDHLRHAQAVVIYLVELENYSKAVDDAGGRTRWLEDPIYQPARRLAERIINTNDWAELLIGLNLAVGPLLQQVVVSDLVRKNAGVNGDPVASSIVLTVERDRRRNLAAAEAFVRMVIDPAVPQAADNSAVIKGWLTDWSKAAEAALAPMAPVFGRLPQAIVTFEAAVDTARSETAALHVGLGLGAEAG